jgi:hypothetical protein
MPEAAQATTPSARQTVMMAVSEAVIKAHEAALREKPEWFWHLLKRCEVKSERIAEQATHGPQACGDATFIEIYAKTLPALLTAALDAHERAINREA